MAITPLHPISSKNVRHVVAAAARSQFAGSPGSTYHTTGDESTGKSAILSGTTSYIPRIEMDPLVEEAWDAAKESLNKQSQAMKSSVEKWGQAMNDAGGALWHTLEEQRDRFSPR
eukprot:TRINITY_DN8751_c0_g1_i1.p1 TRINITY_DN8751_c0_g1~~TRINITY_DN8751_c0_g1_i1.p1  ORF type:complete len:115 (-),score=12.11 TRINITY_DN8751_c0_g1_i1:1247-1591(-)